MDFELDEIINEEECHICDWEEAEAPESFPKWMKRNKVKEIAICDYHMLEVANQQD